jgi:endo-1,3-1,4-beta-glycanase ExoK
MKQIAFGSILVIALLTLATCGDRSVDNPTQPSGNGAIAPNPSFVENFDSIDATIWQVASWHEESWTDPARCTVSNGKLNMVFRYDSATQTHLGAAIQTWGRFLYGRWEARLKPSSVAGVLNSFYTIDWDNLATPGSSNDGTKQEIDIEFLTYTFGPSTGKIHFAVHQAGLASFNLNPDIELGFNPSDGFHTYGYEITPDHIQWIVDGQVLNTYTYAENAITINSPYQLKLNVWSAVNWVHGPPVANTDCVYQIDWIKFYPYIGNE